MDKPAVDISLTEIKIYAFVTSLFNTIVDKQFLMLQLLFQIFFFKELRRQ